MVAFMGSRKVKTEARTRAEGTVDFFTRVPEEVGRKFDELVEEIRPKTSRSALIASMIEQYVEQHYPALEKRRPARG